MSKGCWILNVDTSDADNPVTIVGSPISPSTAAGKPNAFIKQTSGDGVDSYFLQNYKKMEMPISGGMGTILFTTGGILLMGAAVIFFVLTGKARKRKNQKAQEKSDT